MGSRVPAAHLDGCYRYCALLLAKREWAAALNRASQTMARPQLKWPLNIALDELILGRAHAGMAIENAARHWAAAAASTDAGAAQAGLEKGIDGVRAASRLEFVPLGLLARAAFRRSVGDWDGAAGDLDEVEEIAEPGPMRLYLCDMALGRPRSEDRDAQFQLPPNSHTCSFPPTPLCHTPPGSCGDIQCMCVTP